MYQYRLYNEYEIEKLKEDLKRYQDAAYKYEGNKKNSRELSVLRDKLEKLKGEMKIMEESYREKIKHKEQEEQKWSTHFRYLNDSIDQLKQDVSLIKGEVRANHVQDLLTKVDKIMVKTTHDLTKVKKEIGSQKTELSKLKSSVTSTRQKTPSTSDFRQIQTILGSIDSNNQPKQQKNTFRPKNSISFSSNQSNGNSQQSSMSQSGSKTFYNARIDSSKNIIIRPPKRKMIEQDNEKMQIRFNKDVQLEQEQNAAKSEIKEGHQTIASEKNISDSASIPEPEQIKPGDNDQSIPDQSMLPAETELLPNIEEENISAPLTSEYEQTKVEDNEQKGTPTLKAESKTDLLPTKSETNLPVSLSTENEEQQTIIKEKDTEVLEAQDVSEIHSPGIDIECTSPITDHDHHFAVDKDTVANSSTSKDQNIKKHEYDPSQNTDAYTEDQTEKKNEKKTNGLEKAWLFTKSLWKKPK